MPLISPFSHLNHKLSHIPSDLLMFAAVSLLPFSLHVLFASSCGACPLYKTLFNSFLWRGDKLCLSSLHLVLPADPLVSEKCLFSFKALQERKYLQEEAASLRLIPMGDFMARPWLLLSSWCSTHCSPPLRPDGPNN